MILFARILVCFIIGSRGRRLEGHKGLRTSARMPIRSAAAPLESDTLPAYGKLSVEGRTLGFDSMVVYHQQTKQAVNVVFSHFLFSAYSQFRVTSTSDYDSSFFHSMFAIFGHDLLAFVAFACNVFFCERQHEPTVFSVSTIMNLCLFLGAPS